MKIELEFFDARCYFPNHGERVLALAQSGTYLIVEWDSVIGFCTTNASGWDVVRWARLPA